MIGIQGFLRLRYSSFQFFQQLAKNLTNDVNDGNDLSVVAGLLRAFAGTLSAVSFKMIDCHLDVWLLFDEFTSDAI